MSSTMDWARHNHFRLMLSYAHTFWIVLFCIWLMFEEDLIIKYFTFKLKHDFYQLNFVDFQSQLWYSKVSPEHGPVIMKVALFYLKITFQSLKWKPVDLCVPVFQKGQRFKKFLFPWTHRRDHKKKHSILGSRYSMIV